MTTFLGFLNTGCMSWNNSSADGSLSAADGSLVLYFSLGSAGSAGVLLGTTVTVNASVSQSSHSLSVSYNRSRANSPAIDNYKFTCFPFARISWKLSFAVLFAENSIQPFETEHDGHP